MPTALPAIKRTHPLAAHVYARPFHDWKHDHDLATIFEPPGPSHLLMVGELATPITSANPDLNNLPRGTALLFPLTTRDNDLTCMPIDGQRLGEPGNYLVSIYHLLAAFNVVSSAV